MTTFEYLRLRFSRRVWMAAVVFPLAACTTIPPTPGIGPAVSWSDLPGWSQASLVSAWPALLHSCSKLASREPRWRVICAEAALVSVPTEAQARAFFETRFQPHLQRGMDATHDGLITGYYEPLLDGSYTRTERFRFPLYAPPDNLLSIDLGALYPELKNKRVRGRLDGRRVVPYFSRAEIDGGTALAGNELLWVDDPVALFFLQIQGSGRVRLPSGETVHLGYADQNGHPYAAIGRTLVTRGALKLEEVDVPAIRNWLAANPAEAQALLNSNPSYVFFALRDNAQPGARGAFDVPLVPERAIAIDPMYIPLGVPVWLDTTLPGMSAPYRQLVFAHDTGGAIRGPVRADVFFGHGPEAEERAGRMRQPGRLYVLLPATR